MKKAKRLWMPVLLGALLMAALVGVASARPNARPEASPALRDHMISAHHCIPKEDTTDLKFGAAYLECDSALCQLQCPVKPPHEGLTRVQRFAMYAYDNAGGEVRIWLRQVYPKTGTIVDRVVGATTSDSANDPEVYAYNPANFKVSELQDLHVFVNLSSVGQRLYGFKLKYEPL